MSIVYEVSGLKFVSENLTGLVKKVTKESSKTNSKCTKLRTKLKQVESKRHALEKALKELTSSKKEPKTQVPVMEQAK